MEGNVWGDARKAASLREAPPSRSLPKRFVGARFWGGGRFSGRSSATSIGAANGRLFRLRKTAMLSRHWRLWLSFPSSPDPFSRRAAGVWGGCFFGVGSACELGVSPLALSESTVADRAAADMRRGGIRRHVHKHMAADTRHAKPPLKGEVPAVGGRRGSFPAPHGRGGSVSRRDLNQLIENPPHSQAEPTPKQRTKPIANRSSGVGGLGGEGLLSEKPPLPQNLPASLTSQPLPMRRGRGGFGRSASGEERRASLRRGREQCLNRAPRGRWCLR